MEQSTNQQLRMQTQFTGIPVEDEARELRFVMSSSSTASLDRLSIDFAGCTTRKFKGIEFAVVHAEPPSLFIIHKRLRESETSGSLLYISATHSKKT
jgi:mediator of RNA polymerase II transcription subunit 6